VASVHRIVVVDVEDFSQCVSLVQRHNREG
jgi:hypothetical protein